MDKSLDITLNGQRVGKCQVKVEGLYCVFRCHCKFPTDGVYRIRLRTEKGNIRLGIPVPTDNEYVLHTKLPLRRLPAQIFTLEAYLKGDNKEEIIIPLRPGEPFAHIRQLPHCILVRRNGALCLEMTNKK
jgi:hypothetical protein